MQWTAKNFKMEIMKKKTNTNSPIKGLGNDIIEIDRIQKAIDRHGQNILDRLFTVKEQKYCLKFKDAITHFAGRFAAKEAVAKALGVGLGTDLLWKDIEILNDKNGKPEVNFSSSVIKKFDDPKILISISHSKKHAIATAIFM